MIFLESCDLSLVSTMLEFAFNFFLEMLNIRDSYNNFDQNIPKG